MLTKEQENALERLVLERGADALVEECEDGAVLVHLEDGSHHLIDRWGDIQEQPQPKR